MTDTLAQLTEIAVDPSALYMIPRIKPWTNQYLHWRAPRVDIVYIELVDAGLELSIPCLNCMCLAPRALLEPLLKYSQFCLFEYSVRLKSKLKVHKLYFLNFRVRAECILQVQLFCGAFQLYPPSNERHSYIDAKHNRVGR